MATADFFAGVAEDAKRAVGGDAVWDRLTMQERSRAIYAMMRHTDALSAGRDDLRRDDAGPLPP